LAELIAKCTSGHALTDQWVSHVSARYQKLTPFFKFIRSVTLSGHEDWIRALAFRTPSTPNDPLVLASGSQDGTIRLWNVESFTKMQTQSQTHSKHSGDDLSDDLLDAFEASLGDLGADAEEGGRQISLKRHILTVKSNSGCVEFVVKIVSSSC
jgi:elongator complex protein 2